MVFTLDIKRGVYGIQTTSCFQGAYSIGSEGQRKNEKGLIPCLRPYLGYRPVVRISYFIYFDRNTLIKSNRRLQKYCRVYENSHNKVELGVF